MAWGDAQDDADRYDVDPRDTAEDEAFDRLKPWLVCSPEYGEVMPITDEGQGPMEYGCDVVHVEAETPADALLLGVKLFKQQGARYLDKVDNPYAGVTVHTQICHEHGQARWVKDHYECQECEAS